MKKIVLCVCVFVALAAAGAKADELPTRPPYIGGYTSPSVSPALWTGVYLGINGGYGWSGATPSYAANDPAALAGTSATARGTGIPLTPYAANGALGGGQIGYNLQLDHWLVGVEADYQWAHFRGMGISPFRLGGVGTTNMVVNESMDSFGTLRARVGLVPANPLLLYGTGGLAYGQVKENFSVANTLSTGSATVTSGGFSYVCTAGVSTCFAGSSSKTVFGWSLGFGGEYLITDNISFKTEYLYVALPVQSGTIFAQNTVAGTTPASFSAKFGWEGYSIARAGLSYKF